MALGGGGGDSTEEAAKTRGRVSGDSAFLSLDGDEARGDEDRRFGSCGADEVAAGFGERGLGRRSTTGLCGGGAVGFRLRFGEEAASPFRRRTLSQSRASLQRLDGKASVSGEKRFSLEALDGGLQDEVCEASEKALLSTPGPMQVSELDTPWDVVSQRRGALFLAGSNAAARLSENPSAPSPEEAAPALRGAPRRRSSNLPPFPEGANSVSVLTASSRLTKGSQSSLPPLSSDLHAFSRETLLLGQKNRSSASLASSRALLLHSPDLSRPLTGALSGGSAEGGAAEADGSSAIAPKILRSSLAGFAGGRASEQKGSGVHSSEAQVFKSIASSQAVIRRTRQMLKEAQGLALDAAPAERESEIKREVFDSSSRVASRLSDSTGERSFAFQSALGNGSLNNSKGVSSRESRPSQCQSLAGGSLKLGSVERAPAFSEASASSSSASLTSGPAPTSASAAASSSKTNEESRTTTATTGGGAGAEAGGVSSSEFSFSAAAVAEADPSLSYPGRHMKALAALKESSSLEQTETLADSWRQLSSTKSPWGSPSKPFTSESPSCKSAAVALSSFPVALNSFPLETSLALSEVDAVAGFLAAEGAAGEAPVSLRSKSHDDRDSAAERETRGQELFPTLLAGARASASPSEEAASSPSGETLQLPGRMALRFEASLNDGLPRRTSAFYQSPPSHAASGAAAAAGASASSSQASCNSGGGLAVAITQQQQEPQQQQQADGDVLLLGCTADFGRGREGESSSARSSLPSSPNSTFTGTWENYGATLSLRQLKASGPRAAPLDSFASPSALQQPHPQQQQPHPQQQPHRPNHSSLPQHSQPAASSNPARPSLTLCLEGRLPPPENLKDISGAAAVPSSVHPGNELREARLRLRDSMWGVFRQLEGKLRLAGLPGAPLWQVAGNCNLDSEASSTASRGSAFEGPSQTGTKRPLDEASFWRELETTETYVQTLVKTCAEALDETLEAFKERGEKLVQLQRTQETHRLAAARSAEGAAALRRRVESLNFELEASRAVAADLERQLERAAGVYRQQQQQQRKIESLQQQLQGLRERMRQQDSQLRQKEAQVLELEKERALASRLQQQRLSQRGRGFFQRSSVGAPPNGGGLKVAVLESENAALKTLVEQKVAAHAEEVESLKAALAEAQEKRSPSPEAASHSRFAEQEKRHAAQVVVLEAEADALRRSLQEERARRLKNEAAEERQHELRERVISDLRKSKEELELEVEELRRRPTHEEFAFLQGQLIELQEQLNPLKMNPSQREDGRLMMQCDRALQKMPREKLQALLKGCCVFFKCLPGGLPLAVSNFSPSQTLDKRGLAVDQLVKALRRKIRLQGRPRAARDCSRETLHQQKVLYLAKGAAEAKAQAKALSNYASLRRPLLELLCDDASLAAVCGGEEGLELQMQDVVKRLQTRLLRLLISETDEDEAGVADKEESRCRSQSEQEALLRRLEQVQTEFAADIDQVLARAASADARLLASLRSRLEKSDGEANSPRRQNDKAASELSQRQTEFLQELQRRLAFSSEEECFTAVSAALKRNANLLRFFKIICRRLSIPHSTATFSRVEAEVVRLLEQEKHHCELLQQQNQFLLQQQILFSSSQLLGAAASPPGASKKTRENSAETAASALAAAANTASIAEPSLSDGKEAPSVSSFPQKNSQAAAQVVASLAAAVTAAVDKAESRGEFSALLKCLETLGSNSKAGGSCDS